MALCGLLAPLNIQIMCVPQIRPANWFVLLYKVAASWLFGSHFERPPN